MKSKKQFAAAFFLLCAAAVPVWAQEAGAIAPPSWMEGIWTYTESFPGEEEGEAEAAMRFTADDIFFDDIRLSRLMAEGEATEFAQNAKSSSYEIYVRFSNGYWYRETFQKPSAADTMRSSYTTSEGDSRDVVYTRGRP